MIGIKPLLRVLSLLAVAIAAGQLVETQRVAADRPAADAGLAQTAPAATTDFGALTAIMPVVATTVAQTGDGCTATLQLTAMPVAMIDLVLAAPCNAGQRVVVRHAGLSFTAVVGQDGHLRLQLPALEGEAMVAVYLGDAHLALGQVPVPDLPLVTRFAIQVPPLAQIDLRASAADFVYVSAPAGTPGEGLARVLVLGAAQVPDPILAQIYTHPGTDQSLLDLTLDLHITKAVCGRKLPVATWLHRDGKLIRDDLKVVVPDCGTVGTILVLKNLVPAPTLSSSD